MTASKKNALGSSKTTSNGNTCAVPEVPTPPSTNSGSSSSSSGENSSDFPSVQNASISRKANKPLMEKRRRARINESLAVLKEMVVLSEGDKKTSTAAAKLEKADILELTVKHLTELCQSQNKAQELWRNGYNQCLEKTKTFLEMSGNQTIYGNLMNHLDTTLNHEIPFMESSVLLSPHSTNSIEELEPEPVEEYLNLSLKKKPNPNIPPPDEPMDLTMFHEGRRAMQSFTWRPW